MVTFLKRLIKAITIVACCLQCQSVSCTCGGTLPWGEVISLPRDQHGNYENNLKCTFQAKFQASIAPNVLELSWYDFDIAGNLPDCDTDYVEIFVSCSYTSIGKFCGNRKPSAVISPDRCLRVVFHSDDIVTGRGFKARLIVAARPRGLVYLYNPHRRHVKLNSSSESGLVSSPGYPARYPAHCTLQTFTFETTLQRTAVRLYFMDFDTQGSGVCKIHKDDILTIKVRKSNGKDVVFKLCGQREPFFLTWTGDHLRISIKFTSNNDSFVSRGFVAGYIIYQLTEKSTGSIAIGTVASVVLPYLCFIRLFD